MNGSFIRHKNFGSRLFPFVTKHAFDRQSDRQTDGQKGYSNTMRMHSQSHGNYAAGPEVEPRPVPVQPFRTNGHRVKPCTETGYIMWPHTQTICLCMFRMF